MSWLSEIQDGWRNKKTLKRKKSRHGVKMLKGDGMTAACRNGRHAACFSLACKCEHHGNSNRILRAENAKLKK